MTLSPSHVPPDRSAIAGHFEIVNHGEDITAGCRVVFADEDKLVKGQARLDKTGWVFGTVKPGPTYLAIVSCTLPHFLRQNLRVDPSVPRTNLPGFAEYESRNLAFQAAGSGRLVYFGHVRIDMHAASQGLQAELEEPEKPRTDDSTGPQAEVQSRFEEMVSEYQRRYGGDAAALKPEVALATERAGAVGVLTTAPAPTLGLGFALGGDVATAETRCTGLGLTWQKLDDGGASCSGAAVDLGVPATVKLTACAGAICEIAADASADGAPWSTLAQRFTKLSRRLAAEHGDKHQRATRPLDGCAQGSTDCFASGRVLKSETWTWPDKQRVSLVIDGGPTGGSPSLHVVYRTGAFQEAKP